jgi:hypothetical protein
MACPVPPAGAGGVVELGAEGGAAAGPGQPRHAGVVQLGHARIRRAAPPAQLGGELGQQTVPYLWPVRPPGRRPGVLQRACQRPPAAGLVPGPGRADLPAQRAHRRDVDRGEAQRHGPGQVAQLAPGQRRGERDVDVAAAARRGIGNTPAAEPAHQPYDRVGLGADLPGGLGRAAAAGRVEVKGQHPPGARAGVVDRHRARLPRRVGGQRPRVPGRIRAAAVARDPHVRRPGQRRRDGTPGGLRAGAREAVGAVSGIRQLTDCGARRVARRQY